MKFCSFSALVFCGATVFSCGDRLPEFDIDPIDSTASANQAVGLNEAVAIVDQSLDRVMILQAERSGGLRRTALRVGQNPIVIRSDISGNRLLVLSRGVQPRLRPLDELPSLTVLGAKGQPSVISRYELTEPLERITLDSEGRWAVLAGSEGGDSVVSNPNQLVLIDLEDEDFEPVNKTIRSFGSAPQRFFFTESLDVPGGERRFLVVETNQDIHLVDLADLDAPEITIPLPRGPSGAVGRPTQVVVHAGEDDVDGDARIAIRLANDTGLLLIAFAPQEAEDSGNAFSPTVNLVNVSGVPSAVEFVRTDSGVRLAVLVPSRSEAILVDPETTRKETLSLPSRFDNLRRVELQEPDEGDMALLWGEDTTQVAFWSLGRTADRAFRSIDVLNLDASIRSVLDVPGRRLAHRKLVQSDDQRFFVLDLKTRQSFPMFGGAEGRRVSLKVADDGGRAWAFEQGATGLAQINLDTLTPTSLRLERPIQNVFDIGINLSDDRTMIALHPGGALGATIMDALDPDTARTSFVPGLLLGGLL